MSIYNIIGKSYIHIYVYIYSTRHARMFYVAAILLRFRSRVWMDLELVGGPQRSSTRFRAVSPRSRDSGILSCKYEDGRKAPSRQEQQHIHTNDT